MQVLKPLTHDDLEHYRKSALNVLEYLLESKPENEEIILEIIVNKLGDMSKKIQCHTIYMLLKLTQKHKEMAEVIVREVHLFMTRANTKNQHIFYSIAYLNRVASMVAPKDEKVRVMLFRIYFSMFKKILKTEKDEQKVEEVKKDRTKSKRDNQRAKNKKPVTNELSQEDNKVAELILKGVNILMVKCANSQSNSELK